MSVATAGSALILVLCGYFCATEVQAVEVTAVPAGAYNSQQDARCLKGKEVGYSKEEKANHDQRQNSLSISPNALDYPRRNCSVCPPWHHHSPSASGNDLVCECGDSLGGVVQYDDHFNNLKVLACYCMYFNEDDDSTIVGRCFFTCFCKIAFFRLPLNGSQLNEVQCGNLNREGQLCGSCKKGYSLPVYSYQFLSCVKCHDYSYKNWVKYIAIAFGPLTVFFIIVIVCRISATSAKLSAFILINQMLVFPAHMRIILAILTNNPTTPLEKVIAHTVFSLYGIWNLDFFRTFYDPFCLHPDMSPLQVLALDYIVAAYPLVLIVITYTLVELHDRNIRIVVLLWKPFHRCFSRFRRQWNIRTSLIDAFATFILLSCVKFFGITFDILAPTRLFNSYGDALDQYYVYYDPTVELFDKQHLPYGLIGVVILSLLVLLLLLLCLYPCTCFQRCLNCCGLRFQALHTLMDSFQGCYRNSPRDCRYFAVVYLMLRVAFLVAYSVTLSLFFYFIATALIILTAIAVAIVKPYKSYVQNTLDIVLLLMLALCYVSLAAVIVVSKVDFEFMKVCRVMLCAAVLAPLVYLFALLVHSLVCQRPAVKGILRRALTFATNGRSRTDSVESLPHRIDHAEEYTTLEFSSEATYGSIDSTAIV